MRSSSSRRGALDDRPEVAAMPYRSSVGASNSPRRARSTTRCGRRESWKLSIALVSPGYPSSRSSPIAAADQNGWTTTNRSDAPSMDQGPADGAGRLDHPQPIRRQRRDILGEPPRVFQPVLGLYRFGEVTVERACPSLVDQRPQRGRPGASRATRGKSGCRTL